MADSAGDRVTPLDALEAVGLTVYDHRVAPRPGGWEPFGVFWHHVGNLPPRALVVPAPSIGLCQRGRSDVPGPLCQWLVDGEGGWNWITDGRANHAGSGDRDVFEWLIAAGVRADDPPRANGDDSSLMNRYTVGVEVEGNGNWSPKVYDAMLRGTRALLKHYDARRDNLVSHKESTTRKADPAGIDMHAARAWLRQHPTPPPIPQPQPDPEALPDMDFFILNDANDSTADQWYWWPELGADDTGRKAIVPRGSALTGARASRRYCGDLELDRPDLDAIPKLRD